MNKLKLIFVLIIASIIGLFTWDNRAFLFEEKSISINLFVKTFNTPSLPTGVILLICFFAGLLVAYTFALFEHFRLKGQIKGLNYTIDSNIEKIAELKNEVLSLRNRFSSEQKDQS
jgi:uncharacterized integral membrane protein